jgi:hypothetical protein
MPYRAAIESVIARCDEIRARIERLQHVPVPVERCDSIDEALAWEARLHEIATLLEANRAIDEEDFTPTVHDSSDARAWPPKPRVIHGVVAAALVIATVIVFVVQLR